MGITYLLVTLSAFFWGANFVLAGPVLADLPPLWASAMRFVLGAILMFAIAGLNKETLIAPIRRHASTYLILGTVGIAAFNLLFFYALQSTSANSAALIMATNPLITTLLAAIILGEKPNFKQLLALPVALTGVAVVISQGEISRLISLSFARGDLLMLAANLSWAMYNVLVRRNMPQGSAITNTTWIMASGAAVLLVIATGSGTHIAWPGIRAGLALSVMVLGGTVLAYVFWSIGIQRLGAARTAIFLNLVPVFAMLIGAATNTLPTFAQLAGGMIVLGGVTISMIPARNT